MIEKKKKKPGPPKGVKGERIDLTQDQIDLCYRYGKVGLNNDQLAGIFEVSPRTFDEIMKRQPEVGRAIKRGRADGVGGVAGTLFQKAMEGNMTAAIFFLKTQGRWAEAREVEVAPDKEEYSVPDSMLDDET